MNSVCVVHYKHEKKILEYQIVVIR